MKSPEEMKALFADLPEAIANTVELSSRLEFTLEDLGYEFPSYPVPEGETMISFLRERAREGFQIRYGHGPKDLKDRARIQIERELALIEKLKLPGYFLIVWDLVQFCGQQNILVQGRGSAANSAVCYSLGITAVDPIRMELLFERFLVGRARRVAGHRSRPAQRRRPRNRDPVFVSPLWRARRGHDCQRHYLSQPHGLA